VTGSGLVFWFVFMEIDAADASRAHARHRLFLFGSAAFARWVWPRIGSDFAPALELLNVALAEPDRAVAEPQVGDLACAPPAADGHEVNAQDGGNLSLLE
jgi:hypothetical protein